MLNTIKYTILELIRMPGIMIWSLAFPLILMSVFSLMFGPLDERSSFDPIRIAVVDTADTPEAESFEVFIEALSTGDDRLFDVKRASDAETATKLVIDSTNDGTPLLGYVELVEGTPQVHLSSGLSPQNMEYTEAFILTTAMDAYVSKAKLVDDLLDENPQALMRSEVLDSLYEQMDTTETIEVTRNQPKESVRYYFALLGMAALFGGSASLVAFQRMRPNLSALGARRTVAGLSHTKAILATIIGCWIINFACLTIAYLAMRYVIGIDFGGRDLPCLGVTAVASLTALSLGCAVSSIPKIPENGKSGLLTGIVCFSALFAGLYGQPTMQLADLVAEHAPLLTWINPATQIAQAFYSIMYYDSLIPLLGHITALLVIALVLFLLSVRTLRRQRYASI